MTSSINRMRLYSCLAVNLYRRFLLRRGYQSRSVAVDGRESAKRKEKGLGRLQSIDPRSNWKNCIRKVDGRRKRRRGPVQEASVG